MPISPLHLAFVLATHNRNSSHHMLYCHVLGSTVFFKCNGLFGSWCCWKTTQRGRRRHLSYCWKMTCGRVFCAENIIFPLRDIRVDNCSASVLTAISNAVPKLDTLGSAQASRALIGAAIDSIHICWAELARLPILQRLVGD
jgi:hypothetical protein